MHDWDSAVGLLWGISIQIEASLDAVEMQDIRDFIEYGEPGLAVETICSQLYVHEVPVDDLLYTDLEQLGTYFKLDPKYWMTLDRKRTTAENVGDPSDWLG